MVIDRPVAFADGPMPAGIERLPNEGFATRNRLFEPGAKRKIGRDGR